MARTRSQEIRRSKKKSFYLRELSDIISRIAYDHPDVAQLYITRVDLSEDGGVCYVYFSAYQAETSQEKLAVFETARHTLVTYKGSIRTALSKVSHSRYVPHLRFVFDEQKEREIRVNDLLSQVIEESSDASDAGNDTD